MGAISLGREPNNKFPESISKKVQNRRQQATRKTCLNKITQNTASLGRKWGSGQSLRLLRYDTICSHVPDRSVRLFLTEKSGWFFPKSTHQYGCGEI
jgi:hypothetical protein